MRAGIATKRPAVMAESGYNAFMRSDQRVVLGHEFCDEVVDYGPGAGRSDCLAVVAWFDALGDPEAHATILIDPGSPQPAS